MTWRSWGCKEGRRYYSQLFTHWWWRNWWRRWWRKWTRVAYRFVNSYRRNVIIIVHFWRWIVTWGWKRRKIEWGRKIVWWRIVRTAAATTATQNLKQNSLNYIIKKKLHLHLWQKSLGVKQDPMCILSSWLNGSKCSSLLLICFFLFMFLCWSVIIKRICCIFCQVYESVLLMRICTCLKTKYLLIRCQWIFKGNELF